MVTSRQVPVERYLQETLIPLRLAVRTTAGWPVVLSLWYLFEEGRLLCATPRRAKVVTFLQQDPRCGFEVAADLPPYCGVRGQALATIDEERGMEVLERLLVRYLGGVTNPLAQQLLGRSAPEVAILLEPRSLHTWNFSARMRASLAEPAAKLCPG